MVRAEDLAVSLGGHRVLSDVDLAVDSGSFVGLVGPNGAGKTTLLRTVRAALAPDSGRVRVDGRAVHDLAPKAVSRLVATTPQETSLSFEFTVEQAVEMGRTPHLGRFDRVGERDREAVRAAMERVDVEQFSDRPVTSLSGGERQRVLLARALAQETPVLLLDEPTASLDINHAVNTLELVADLAAEGKTAVAAIHDLNLAARYCDALVLLADGTVRAAGPPSEVLRRPTLRDAFDAETLVTRQPDGDGPLVTPLADRRSTARSVHVVGTGARAAAAVARLAGAGATVSVGVVPAGDAAAERARDLGCPAVTVPPFAGVDDDSLARARDLAGGADAAVRVGEVGETNRTVLDAAGQIVGLSDADIPAGRSPDRTVESVAALPDAVADLARQGPRAEQQDR
jgi:iron complex transport system ATP-binding protein